MGMLTVLVKETSTAGKGKLCVANLYPRQI